MQNQMERQLVHEMETGVIWGLYIASIFQPLTPQDEIFPLWYFIVFREHLTLSWGEGIMRGSGLITGHVLQIYTGVDLFFFDTAGGMYSISGVSTTEGLMRPRLGAPHSVAVGEHL